MFVKYELNTKKNIKFNKMEEKNLMISSDVINNFLEGRDPMERIINMEYNYMEDYINIIYRDENDKRHEEKAPFHPFVWATRRACVRLCNGDRKKVKSLMQEYGIGIKVLSTESIDGIPCPNIDDGYIFIFYAINSMSYNKFLRFFKEANNPIYSKQDDKTLENKKDDRQYLVVTPQEQYMISTGKRYFKGYDDYDNVYRMIFDLETGGLDPYRHRIEQIGIRTNRGFEKIFTITGDSKEEKDKNELIGIETMMKVIYTLRPDVITAHNGENFDWNFIIVRCEVLGTSIDKISAKYFNGQPIYKRTKKSVLKLGGEVEYYYPTVVPGINITDSLHAVRRAQAIDSNMQKADLKYVTKYSKMKKANRVYVPGDKISETWNDLSDTYAFNDSDGSWYKITDEKPICDGYSRVNGKYIVERYLLDDLWECDKVELRYNQPNFLLCKLLPTTFVRCCTMGTAAQWKLLMLAWSYENNLAIPPFGTAGRFTGGLSRLLKTGYVDNVVKLDYNSLYPSIILTWQIKSPQDLQKVLLSFLEYILTQREKYKKLKKNASIEKEKTNEKIKTFEGDEEELHKLKQELAKWAEEESSNDKKQLPLKIFGNSYFGGTGNPSLFPFSNLVSAEKTTCIGRQSLRLMIKWFTDKGYTPVVGDTDGFNFKMPDENYFRYTEEQPYVGKGYNREVIKDKKYVGLKGDVAEFNDLFMRGKMGLGIDEIVSATINFSRKNYSDYFPEESEPNDVKMVGNTIKSKKMPGYIEKFLYKGIRLLLKNQGQKFLEEYYAYIEKIYNYQIPLRDIASRGKIKKSIKEYEKDVKTLTKANRPKSRQAWYELILKEGVKVDVGDTIYYINTGKSKSHADVKKITHYYIINENNEKIDIIKDIEKEYKIYKKENEINPISKNNFIKEKYPNIIVEEEIILNSLLLPNNIIEAENDTFCEDGKEYNSAKYIDQFNKRIKPLLVCFSKEIRDEILINNPSEKKYFTEEQSKLTSGEPNKPGDQDTYEQLMSMEDKEIKFWTSINEEPPFLKECGMNWAEIVKDYYERLEEEKRLGILDERELYDKIIDSLTEDDVDEFIEEGKLPSELLKILDIDPLTNNLISKKYNNIVIGNIHDISEKEFVDNVYED